MLTRRRFLGSLAGAGAGIAFAGFPAIRIGRAAETPLKNIVVLMQENHSFDNYFGLFPGAEGLPACAPLTRARTLCLEGPPHNIEEATIEAETASVDPERFRIIGGNKALTYYTGDDLPYYWALADRFTLCDHYFCSVLGPTTINRVFSIAAAAGTLHDNSSIAGAALPPITIVDRLQEAGVDWRCYTAQQPDQDYNAVRLFSRWRNDPRAARPYAEFLDDAAAGRLPPVSWVVTQEPLSEHGPDDVSWGERFAALTINSLASGPQWKDAALILSYDEHGGFYDHVRPPRVDELGLGFRVPGMVISPYAKAGHVSRAVYEHCSTLALVERTFGLRPLTSRDANASPFEDAFDFGRRELGFVDYPTRSLGNCNGAPRDWYGALLSMPVPKGSGPGRVPSARDLCRPAAPSIDVGAGVVGGLAAGAAAAAAGLRRRAEPVPPSGAPRTPTTEPPRPRTRP